MTEEVRIRIRSVRYDSDAALFDEDDGEVEREEGKIEPYEMEINAVGTLKIEDGQAEISYDETELSGMEGSVTSVTFLLEQKNVVSMLREGLVSTALVFEEGKRHHCTYNTMFMPFQVCVHTLKVDNRLLEEKYLDLDYIIEIRGARAERTKFYMELL